MVRGGEEGGCMTGEEKFWLDGKEIGRVEIRTAESVDEAGFKDYWKKVWGAFLL